LKSAIPYGKILGKFPDLLHKNLEIYKSKRKNLETDLLQKDFEKYKSKLEKSGNFQIYHTKIWDFQIQYKNLWNLTNP